MTQHLSQKQLLAYVYQTLADGERETMDRHLVTCQECRARLAEREAIQRRIRYSVLAWQRQVIPPTEVNFGAIAPYVKRSRRLMMFAKQSNLVLSSAVTILVLIVAGVGVFFLLSNQAQPEPIPQEAVIEQPAVKAAAEISQPVTKEETSSEATVEQPVKLAPENSPPSNEPVPGETSPSPGQLLWNFETDLLPGNLAVANGTVYVATSADGKLHAVDSQSGQEIWQFETDSTINFDITPAVVDGVVYFGTSDGHLYGLDSQTGQKQWQFTIDLGIKSSPTIVDGVVYFGSDDTYLYVVNLKTGQEQWKFKTGGAVLGQPIVTNETVVVGNADGYFYALDRQTGQEQWRFDTGSRVATSYPAITVGTEVYVGSIGQIYALDNKTGQVQWTYKIPDSVLPLAASDGLIYVQGSRTLFAIDSQSHMEKWRTELAEPVLTSTAGILYVATRDGYLYALDSQTGQERWIFDTETGRALHEPEIADGVVYVGSNDGNLYAVWAGSPATETDSTQ